MIGFNTAKRIYGTPKELHKIKKEANNSMVFISICQYPFGTNFEHGEIGFIGKFENDISDSKIDIRLIHKY